MKPFRGKANLSALLYLAFRFVKVLACKKKGARLVPPPFLMAKLRTLNSFYVGLKPQLQYRAHGVQRAQYWFLVKRVR